MNGNTDNETRPFVCPFVHFFRKGRPSFEGKKFRDQPNKYMKLGQLIIRKIIKSIAIRCHILR